MFSGIVEEIGLVKHVVRRPGLLSLTIAADLSLDGLSIGDSMSVNGVCLTVISYDTECFTVEVIPETLKLTNLGDLAVGSQVNLERSITAATRIGGHFVQGHIDTASPILRIEPEGEALKVWFQKPATYGECFIPKGFIAVDGMSLTLVDILPEEFSICFIPHTQQRTIVQHYAAGQKVNIEIDHLTKTVLHIVKQRITL